jgi:protein-L-isoaspartate(D-aspartate) O-methyltransferase
MSLGRSHGFPRTDDGKVNLEAAIADVVGRAYMFTADGSQLPQTSRPDVVHRMLDLLDPAPGMRVLEIGTGSGYSTALLSRLVGPAGHVRSVDVDPDLVTRADSLLRADGAHNVIVVHADGRRYLAADQPFDRLIAWGSSAEVPATWIEQVRQDGLIVAPLRAHTPRVVKLRVVAPGEPPRLEATVAGSFVPLTPEPFRPWEQDNTDDQRTGL